MDVPCICRRVGILTLAPSLGQPHGWDERQGLEQSHLPFTPGWRPWLGMRILGPLGWLPASPPDFP